MKGAARIAAAVAATAAVISEAADPACAVVGKAYVDPAVTTPNGAFLLDSAACQASCASLAFCDKFSFEPNSKPTPGACYLLGNTATEQESATAISGPKKCQEVVTDAGAAPTPETPAAGADGAATPETTAAKGSGDGAAPIAENNGEKTLIAAGPGSAGGVPWYAFVGAGLGAAAVTAGAFGLMGSGSSADTKKKTRQRGLGEDPGAPKKAWQLYAKMVDPNAQFAEESGAPVEATSGFPMQPVMPQGLQMSSMQQMPQMYPMQAAQYSYAQMAPQVQTAPQVIYTTAPAQYVSVPPTEPMHFTQ